MKLGKISIAMATYNGSRFISQQLESIAKQTILPDEIIICDDLSTDLTCEIVRNFTENSSINVKILVNSSRVGVISNFERAISLCGGDYIFLCDQDDVWLPEKVSTVMDTFSKNPQCLVVIHDCISTDRDLAPQNSSVMRSTQVLFGRNDEFILGCCTAIRRTVFPLLFPFPEFVNQLQSHDGWIHFVGSQTNTRIVIESRLMLYRRHGRNTSGSFASTREMMLFDRLRNYLSIFRRKAGPLLLDLQLEARGAGIDLIRERLQHRGKFLKGMLGDDQDDSMQIRSCFIAKRLAIRRQGRAKKFMLAISFYFTGGYCHFSGLKSLLLDLLS